MQKKKTNGLTEREKLFCALYVSYGDCKQACVLSGYSSHPETTGEKLLMRQDILSEISRISLEREKILKGCALFGFARLAFGSVTDAVKLLMCDDLSKLELDNMDFFNISEIKRPKDGSMEIKFFDRLKAIEQLQLMSMQNGSETKPFYRALEESAVLVNKAFKEDE